MTVLHNQKPQAPVKASKHVRMISVNTMTEGQRQMLWLGIKTANPHLAKMLQTDANIAALKQTFNATDQFTADDCNRYLQAGLKAIEERNHATVPKPINGTA
jgi:hypothetical protein